MTDEIVVKVETPETIEPIETVVAAPATEIVAPVVDIAILVGELTAKVELLETTNTEFRNKIEMLEMSRENTFSELNVLRELLKEEEEEIVEIEETPDADLPLPENTLPEIEIIPEVIPEQSETVVKRKRFFV